MAPAAAGLAGVRREGAQAAPAWNGGASNTPVPQAETPRRGRDSGNPGGWSGSGNNGSNPGGWSGSGTGSSNPGGWSSRRTGRADSSGWSGRNRTYSDPNRNGSYRSNQRGRNDRSLNNGNRWSGNDSWRGNRRNSNDRGWNNNRRGNSSWGYNNSHGNWNRDWRRDNRYNWHGYRSSHPDRYRWGRYNAPYRNHYYSRVGIGFYLDSMFYGNNYWIDDPWSYRLPEVHGPYRWIRYYDDALLVDIYSGEVVDVIENFFW